MNEPRLAEPFRSFVKDGGSVVDGALLVSRVVNAETDTQWCHAELQRLAEFAGFGVAPAELVESLRDQGFGGMAGGYFKAENSSLEDVLRKRRGIPISLAVVIIGTADCLELNASGINFPQHFLVAFDDVLVDPFAMQVTNEATCRTWLRRNNIVADDAAFIRAGPVDVVLRMLNNLRTLAISGGDHAHALELTDYQLILRPDAYGLHIDRADIWLSLGSLDMVRDELQRAMELANEGVKEQIQARLKALPDYSPTLN